MPPGIPHGRLASSLCISLWAAAAQAGLSPVQLRCEYLTNPLGIDTVQPRLSWVLESEQRNQRQTAYRILVASTPERLARNEGDLWDSRRVESHETHLIPYGGKRIRSGQRCFWKVGVWDHSGSGPVYSVPAWWEIGLLSPELWEPARWIAAKPCVEDEKGPRPRFQMPYLRRSFPIEKPVGQARLYVTSLGYHNVYLNGKKVGNHELDPLQSDYAKRVFYVTHDVTGQIRQGDNMLGAWLGKGWYIGQGVEQPCPALLAKLIVEHADGTRTEVVSDDGWLAAPSPLSLEGPITGTGGRFGSQCYDARLERTGWNDSGADNSCWSPVAVLNNLLPRARSAQMMQPNRVLDRFQPLEVVERATGEYLIDFGRNFVGYLRLVVRNQEPGDELELTYSASHTDKSDRLAEVFGQVDRYICRGGDHEEVRPHLDWRTFRFVLAKGLKSKPVRSDISAELVATDTAEVSRFECSAEPLNRLDRMVRDTHRCLTLGGIQVDCPHRERLGYGAEGQAAMRQALWNFDVGAFYTKWARDFADGQDAASGAVHYTAPYRVGSGGGPAWPGALIAFPWQCYQFLADKRLLADLYPAMCRWIEFLERHADGGVMLRWQFRPTESYWEFLGDWAPPKTEPDYAPDGESHWPCRWGTPEENQLFNSMSYAHQTQMLADIAQVLGKKDDAARYAASAETIRQAIRQKWFDAETANFRGTRHPQTYLAFGLQSGAVPSGLRDRAMRNLTTDLVRRGHFDTGVLGSFYLIETLLAHRRSDLIRMAVSQPCAPSWQAMLNQGATTLWEHWTPEWSSVHNSFLSIGGWFLPGVAGLRLDPQHPGFRHVVIRPELTRKLTFAGARYRSVRGLIGIEWRRDAEALRLRVDIPPNVEATVHLPADTTERIRESGNPIGQAEGVACLRGERGSVLLRVSSGRYEFMVPP